MNKVWHKINLQAEFVPDWDNVSEEDYYDFSDAIFMTLGQVAYQLTINDSENYESVENLHQCYAPTPLRITVIDSFEDTEELDYGELGE